MVENLTYQDRLLPVQHEQSNMFQGDSDAFIERMYGAITSVCQLKSPHAELNLDLTPMHRIEEMASAPLNLRFLQSIIIMTGAKRVLEIGAFIGVSATYMAKALPSDGEIVSIEKFDHFAKICRNNLRTNHVEDRVRLIEGDAIEVLSSLQSAEPFDFALIDGDKGRYDQYFDVVDSLIRPGGVIYVDDVFFHGDALNNQPSTEKGQGVKKFLDALAKRHDYFTTALPLGNGVVLAIKKT